MQRQPVWPAFVSRKSCQILGSCAVARSFCYGLEKESKVIGEIAPYPDVLTDKLGQAGLVLALMVPMRCACAPFGVSWINHRLLVDRIVQSWVNQMAV